MVGMCVRGMCVWWVCVCGGYLCVVGMCVWWVGVCGDMCVGHVCINVMGDMFS